MGQSKGMGRRGSVDDTENVDRSAGLAAETGDSNLPFGGDDPHSRRTHAFEWAMRIKRVNIHTDATLSYRILPAYKSLRS